MARRSVFLGLLLRAYPREWRAREQKTLEAACRACLARERERLGPLGTPYAWIRLIADTVAAAILLRLDGRRRARLARHHASRSAPKEIVMSRVWQDVRYAARRLRRAPMFSFTVIATLALAIGATTAVFTVVNGVLLRALPYHDPARLVLLHQNFPNAQIGFSAPDYVAFEPRAGSFDAIAVFRNREFELSGVEPSERVTVTRASASLFETIGVQPAVGAPFTRDDVEARRPVAVLSDALWARKFGRDPAVIGKPLLLDRFPYTILGVMPRGFTFPQRGPRINNEPADVYLPLAFTPAQRTAFGSSYNISVIARLKPGVSTAQADTETRALVQSNARELYPADLTGLAAALAGSATSFSDEVIGGSRRLLWIALAAVALVLLVACTNIASLMLARALAREREITVCSALGASRARIARQLFAESWIVALAGSVLGLFVGVSLSKLLVGLAPQTLPRLDEVGLDVRVLLFTATLTVVTALLCGVLPALELSRPQGKALKASGRASAGRRERRIFGSLVTAQIALAVVLLVGGGLLLRSFSRLMSVDPGFRPERVLTLATSIPAQAYRDAAAVRGFYTRVLDDLAQVPGVNAVGASTDLPLGVRDRRLFTMELETPATRDLSHGVAHQYVAGQFLEAMDVPLKRGRHFGIGDAADSEPVVIINETMARVFWGESDPVGQRIAFGTAAQPGPWMRIAGVVGDVKHGPLSSQIEPHMYTPWVQARDAMLAESALGIMRSLRIALRSEIEPTSLINTVRTRIRAIDPALPVTSVQTMSEVVTESAAVPRFNALLVSLFAVLALVLAAIGIGGMLAMSVSRRLAEVGIRMALGAQRGALAGMVIRQGMLLAAIGLTIGLPTAWLLSRVLSSLLFEITPRDPATFATVAGVLCVVALTACAVPAWRVTRIDPLKVLKIE